MNYKPLSMNHLTMNYEHFTMNNEQRLSGEDGNNELFYAKQTQSCPPQADSK